MGALRWNALVFPAILAACGADAASSGAPGQGAAEPPSGASQAPIPPAPPAELPLPPSGKRLGAVPYDGGVEVRVWAPNAKAAAVAGAIAGAAGSVPLAAEDGGYFAARLDGAKAGQTYHFEITAADGTVLTRLDPRARAIDPSGEAVVVDPRSYAWKSTSFTPPKQEDTVVYELHVGSFSPEGTFAGAIAELPRLADLGVSAIELMPIDAHGGGVQSWGYGPDAYFAPHGPYGTPDDLRRLVDEAHARGIAVLLDVVFNHYDGWSKAPLRCFDGACPDGTAGIYFFEKGDYEKTPWGPRPDYARKEVSDFLADDVFMWTTEYAIDGFRHDSVSNVRALDGQGSVPGGAEVLRRMNDVTRSARPGALRIAEDLKGYAAITEDPAQGGFGFDAQWDGGFQYDVVAAVTAASDAARDLGAVKNAITAAEGMRRVLYVESHDTAGNDGARLPAKIDGADPTSLAARKRSLLAAGVLLTSPGVPMIFMGQEMLESTKFASQPAPLDWSKADTFAGVRTFYRDLIRLRRNLDGVSAGLVAGDAVVTHDNESPGNEVLVVKRGDVMVVMNFGGKRYARYDIGLPSGGAWKARLDGDDVRYGADFGSNGPTPVGVSAAPRDGLPFTGSIALGPYSVVVLSPI